MHSRSTPLPERHPIDGYPSRLHYFSEWIGDNERKRLMTDISVRRSAGELDAEPIDFMSTHPDAYRQLADPERARRDIEAIEEALSACQGRFFIPQDRIA